VKRAASFFLFSFLVRDKALQALYDALSQLASSPVVEVNRAVAYAFAFGPAEGLTVLDAVTADERSSARTTARSESGSVPTTSFGVGNSPLAGSSTRTTLGGGLGCWLDSLISASSTCDRTA
jgi:hypothetical protein